MAHGPRRGGARRPDDFDTADEELGAIFDHLRQVGMRGFIAGDSSRHDVP